MCAALMFLLLPLTGEAHPHVFIDYSVVVMFGPGGPEGVQFAWTFDEFFSSMILLSFDSDRDNAFSAKETKTLEARHFGGLRAYHYFVQLQLNGKPVTVTEVRDFRARAARGQVTYTFTVPIRTADPANGTLVIVADDPTYYSALMLAKNAPVQVQAPAQYRVQCTVGTDKNLQVDAITCTYQRQAR